MRIYRIYIARSFLMKLLKKFGIGIISLGLISTFYIPELKANLTILKWEMPSNEPSGGRSYAIKIKNSLIAHSGSKEDKDTGKHKKWEKSKGSGTCHKHLIRNVEQATKISV